MAGMEGAEEQLGMGWEEVLETEVPEQLSCRSPAYSWDSLCKKLKGCETGCDLLWHQASP